MTNPLPTPAELRVRLSTEVLDLRAQFRRATDHWQPNRMVWCGREFWVDQVRWLVLPMVTARDLQAVEERTVPSTQEDSFRFRGLRQMVSNSRELLVLWQRWLQSEGERFAANVAADFLNLAVVQPLVNPPFDALFWLALEFDLGRPPMPVAETLSELMAPLVFEMREHPECLADEAGVREGQVRFLAHEYFGLGLDLERWRAAPAADWANECRRVLESRNERLERDVLQEVIHLARRASSST